MSATSQRGTLSWSPRTLGAPQVVCDGMALRRIGERGIAEVPQIKRAANGRQVVTGHLEGPRGRVEGPMPEPSLDRTDVDARFEQRGRTRVPARCDIMLHLIDNS